MEVRRAASIKPVSPDERRDDLYESTRQFLHCPNRAPRSVETATSTECMTAKLTTQERAFSTPAKGTRFHREPCSGSYPTCRPTHESVCRTVETEQAREPTGVPVVEHTLGQAKRNVLIVCSSRPSAGVSSASLNSGGWLDSLRTARSLRGIQFP